jgi:rubrerythrin
LPRSQEYLKTGFTAEAASAAKFRAAAARAKADGHPRLAQAWLDLAAEKDGLAIRQLEAAGQVHGGAEDLGAALAEERYENDSLYPRMVREVDAQTAGIFEAVAGKQREHLARLESLLDALTRSSGDLAG